MIYDVNAKVMYALSPDKADQFLKNDYIVGFGRNNPRRSYRVNGTPADCVALGVDHWGGTDLVLSGIPMGRDHYWFTVTPVGEADPEPIVGRSSTVGYQLHP